ncbi:MAG: tripartite tricarboxylate transporter TctB family protein [Micrococcaceae bacterium]
MDSDQSDASVMNDSVSEVGEREVDQLAQAREVADWFSPILVAAVGIALLIPSAQLGVGTLNHPGVGLWPAINSILLILMAPLIFVARRRIVMPNRAGLANVLGIAVPLLLSVPLYTWMGLIGAGAVSLFIISKFIGRMTWLGSLLTTVLVPVAVYLVFAVALGVNLRAF